MKGVVLAGGSGTRLHPLTRAQNKHLLEIAGRPMIAYAVDALSAAGVIDLMVVTGDEHLPAFRSVLGDEFRYGGQRGAGGIAEALGVAEAFVAGERCVVLLGDNIFERPIGPYVERFREQVSGARILLAEEPEPEHLRHLGVAELDDAGRVSRIVEKPAVPPSAYAVTGLYFYDGAVWDVLPTLARSARGELEITDVNTWYAERGLLEHDVLDGFWGDAGESIDAYRAVDRFVTEHGANRP